MDRREFVKNFAVAAGALALSGKALFAGETRPNVLLIIVDQWREPRWFPEKVKLPGYERLCKEGLNFTNHFVSAVPCSPSRACLLTGRHLNQHGVESNVHKGLNQPSLDPDIPTLGHLFKKAGYRTPYFGKWHLTELGELEGRRLEPYGFEDWQGIDHIGAPFEGLEYDRSFASRAIHWLRRNGKRTPWFLTCSFVNPHDICYYQRLDVPAIFIPDVFSKLPANHNDDLKNKPRIQGICRDAYGKLMGTRPDAPERVWLHYLDFYYWLQQHVDRQINHLLTALDQLGLAENTIVVFTSDHGDMCGSHKLQAKGPFVYQENNNVPLVLRWPGKIQAGKKAKALSQNPDLFPTMLDLAGISAPVSHLPGKSLLPVISSPEQTELHDHILMGFGMNGAGRFAHLGERFGLDLKGVPIQIRSIFDGRYKYARYFDEGCQEEYELYDLNNDPLELRNLAPDPAYSDLKKEMADKLAVAESKEMAKPAPDWPKVKL